MRAVEPETGEVKWESSSTAPILFRALTTAGDILFVGDANGNVYMLGMHNGEVPCPTSVAERVRAASVTFELEAGNSRTPRPERIPYVGVQ